MLTAAAWGQEAGPGQKDAGGFRAPTEALERGRVVFVKSSCHFCHGVDLTQTAMGAANLLHSTMDLASYIHYLRQMGKYAELLAADLPPGDASRGKAAFDGAAKCSSCHAAASLAPRLKKQPRELEEQLLLPSVARAKEGVAPDAAAQSHSKFTENASPKDVSDLIAYLRGLK